MNGGRLFVVTRNHLEFGQANLLREFSETLIIDEFLSEIRQKPFLLVGLAFAKLGRNADTQDGIAFELQTFLRIVEQIHHPHWARRELRRLPIGSCLFRTTNLRGMYHCLLKDLRVLHPICGQSMRLQNLPNILLAKRPILAIVRDLGLHTIISFLP